MKCPHCGVEVREYERFCPVCNYDLGYPNVRAAEEEEERSELERRYEAAMEGATIRGCEQVVREFEQEVAKSKAVICRPLGLVDRLVTSDDEIYATFYKLVSAGARRPKDNAADRARLPVDDTLFPYCREEIRFAALSLDGRGVTSYGAYAMVLRERTIAHRATVFEENSLLFFQRRRIPIGDPAPAGFRATWDQRDRPAVAKLGLTLDGHTRRDEFPNVLMRLTGKPDEDDFIEVHIYGSLHRRGIERVVGPKPKRKADRVLLRNIEGKLKEVDAILEV